VKIGAIDNGYWSTKILLDGKLGNIRSKYTEDPDGEFEYNSKFKPLPYRIVVIDEFAMLRNEKDTIELMIDLSSIARACGVHLIIATQRPDKDIVQGKIKANITTVIGLKTMNEVNSRIIIDDKGLDKLRGKGHGILKHNGILHEIQAMNLTPEECRDLIKPTFVDKKKEVKGEVIDFRFLNENRKGRPSN
jgi:S-DNA-T family DNA segregation ATPase FtsK/SpoIIIE